MSETASPCADQKRLMCPSAQPEMDDSVVLGVLQDTPEGRPGDSSFLLALDWARSMLGWQARGDAVRTQCLGRKNWRRKPGG